MRYTYDIWKYDICIYMCNIYDIWKTNLKIILLLTLDGASNKTNHVVSNHMYNSQRKLSDCEGGLDCDLGIIVFAGNAYNEKVPIKIGKKNKYQ